MSHPTVHITTAIPYINAKPHLGHVLEWFQADALARYYKLKGKDVSFTSGTDENSLKNVQAAEKQNITVQKYLDEYASIFRNAYDFFGIELTGFCRGSDRKKHWPGVQKLWSLCDKSGDIYKKTYKGLYCVGCESFYNPDDLVDGKCPEHLKEPEEVEEENYFFKLSGYQQQIKNLIESDTLWIVSDRFKNEMLGFIDQGLEDFSISRSIERARGLGVPVPNDSSQIMYVWFDALNIYMTALGWNSNLQKWNRYWKNAQQIIHVIGKGINRFHSIYWIGMLLSAQKQNPDIRLPNVVSVHGYITADGQKMSKSLGNVIDPFELVTEFGLEPIRYYLLKEIPTHNDGDFSYDRFKEIYAADLAKGLGNLCSRVAKLCHKSHIGGIAPIKKLNPNYCANFERFEISEAGKWLQSLVSEADLYLSKTEPWAKPQGKEQTAILTEAVRKIQEIGYHLQPFMPQTAQTIMDYFQKDSITSIKPLFPRL